jgi:hypothetical protein
VSIVDCFVLGGKTIYSLSSLRQQEVGIRHTRTRPLSATALLEDTPSVEFKRKQGLELAPQADLVEEPTAIETGSVVEFVRAGELLVGAVSRVFVGTAGSLFVSLPLNQSVRIGADQVVSVWDEVEDGLQLPDDEWQRMKAEAETLIANLSPRKQTLDEFWQHISQQRTHKLAVDSLDVGVYLFQEGRFGHWLNPYLSAEEARVRPLTAAQRYAAALLLHRDDVYFKRRPTVTVPSLSTLAQADTATQLLSLHSAEPTLAVVEGGYRVLEESQVLFKESMLFERYYTEQLCDISQLESASPAVVDKCHAARQRILRDIAQHRKGTGSAASPTVARALRQLELFALCSASSVSPRWQVRKSASSATAPVPKQVKAMLRRLNMPVTSIGARRVLMNLNQRTTPGYKIVWRDAAEGEPTLMQVPDLSSTAENSEESRPESSKSSVKVTVTKKISQRGAAVLEADKMQDAAMDSAEAAVAGVGEYVQNITPWSAAVAEEARRLALAVERDRRRLADTGMNVTCLTLLLSNTGVRQKLRLVCESYIKTCLVDTLTGISSPGKRGPSGRMDYRSTAAAHPAMCVDARYASFLDDALSLSPETGELLVHVVDVVSAQSY